MCYIYAKWFLLFIYKRFVISQQIHNRVSQLPFMVLGSFQGGCVGRDHGRKLVLNGVVVALQLALVLLLLGRDQRLVTVQPVSTPVRKGGAI